MKFQYRKSEQQTMLYPPIVFLALTIWAYIGGLGTCSLKVEGTPCVVFRLLFRRGYKLKSLPPDVRF